MYSQLKQKFIKFIIRIVVSSLAIIITSWLLSGVHIGEPKLINAILIAFVLSVLNSFIKPVLIFLTIPVSVMTFGFFLFVINAGIILLTTQFVDKFVVDGFWWAFAFSLILSFVTAILDAFGSMKVYKVDNNDNFEQ